MGELDTNWITWYAALASTAVYGVYIYLGLKTPMPGQDQEVSGGLQEERREFTTPDGLTLRPKRYANPGGTPVLLCHGFGANGFEFDIPREGKNLAVFLARNGFDVWVCSFRGCGRPPYHSDGGDWRHSADTLAIYDVPTLVDGVTEVTGKRPFYIGHSLGGIVLYMYLQGARFESEERVVSDSSLVSERNRKILGGITIGSPAAIVLRHPVHAANESSLGRALLASTILTMRLREKFSPRSGVASFIEKWFGSHPRILMNLSRNPAYSLIYCRRNTDKQTTTSAMKWGISDVSVRTYIQLCDSIRSINIRQYHSLKYPYGPYNYTENMDLITTPMLFVAGEEDFADQTGIRLYGFETVSSDIKEFVNIPGYGHSDMVMGLNVESDVFSLLGDWMRGVDKATGVLQ